jgi:hypothetical protein
MSKSRVPLYLGLTVAGAGGYYLYKSGGDVDAATARAKGIASSSLTLSLSPSPLGHEKNYRC